ncbi:MAG: nucleotidyltransferase [Candidatus Rokubacteria bacterium]|nr:nucleotidyltransferase [Candidatus Rokubacteria bacterium]
MSTFVAGSAKTQLDQLLEELCIALQLSPAQYRDAEEKYVAVGTWLADAGSPLDGLNPVIYPQGSMALQTTVKPREHEEFDLDLVLQVEPISESPMTLYEQVYRRLKEHKVYADKIERLKRCIRLNYAKQFHLDILPARADRVRGGTCIEVPDRKLETWVPSNPLGYRDWFEERCAQAVILKEAMQEPLPPNTPAVLKAVLKRAVQLMKRHRDVKFMREDEAPRSIVLTTLAGHFYAGEFSVTRALLAILKGIVGAVEAASPDRIVLVNPTNPAERFCEAWTDKTYRRFTEFVYAFQEEMEALAAARGLDNIGGRLNAMFGEQVGSRVMREYVEKMTRARESGTLGFTAAGLTTSERSAKPIPKNTFYGS